MCARWITFVSQCGSATQRTRQRALFELAGIYALILVVIWTPRPWQWPLWGITGVTLAAVIAVSFDGLEPMGICTTNLRRSLWGVFVALAVATVAVWYAGKIHTLHLLSLIH